MTPTRQQIDEVIARLCRQFPNAFFQRQIKRRPLKIGIASDLLAILGAEIDRKTLGAALRLFVSDTGYLKSLKPGALRFDLEGKASGTVSEEHALSARKALAHIEALAIEKRRKAKAARKPKVAPEPKPAPVAAPPKRDGLSALREAAARRKAVPA